MNTVTVGWSLAGLLILLVASAAIVTRLAGLGRPRDVLLAAARAVVQLTVVSLVIGLVLRSLWLTFAFLLVMVTVAAATSARRITGDLRPGSWWTTLPILSGIVPTLTAILLSTAVPLEPAGRRCIEELTAQRGSYEAALSLGMTRREGVALVARPAALALVPGLDQTRTVGLVTLPGAFVGVLLAGASRCRRAPCNCLS